MKGIINFIGFFFVTSVFISCSGNIKKAESAEPAASQVEQPVVYEHEYLVKVGDIAPDFTLKLTDGSDFKLSEQRGKIIMLQFTASWCGICRREMPHIESDIWQKHKDDSDFLLVGVDRGETKEVVDEYTAKLGTTYPMALDVNGDVFASYALRNSGITRNVLVGRDGRILKLTRGFVQEDFNALVATIDSLLAK